MTSSSNSSAKHSTETTWEMLNLKPVLNPRRSSSAPSQPTLPSMTTSPTHSRKLLDEWPATALCGNDLLSSVFYTLGLCVRLAGIYAPLCFLWVSLVFLLPIRWIYGELGQWMPWNGGSWNVVLTLWARDGTHPRRAHSLLALSGTLSVLSYVATAVVSSYSAAEYAAAELASDPETIGIIRLLFTVILLTGFMVLTIWGTHESSAVALIIFTCHLLLLAVLSICSLLWVILIDGGQTLWNNWQLSPLDLQAYQVGRGSYFLNIFLGICCAMLGITGFETSSNYIEDQKPGVYRKTLRNMWWLVTAVNPPISFLALAVIPLTDLPANTNNLLSLMAERCVGGGFRTLVALDALFALSGGALTAFVGVTGLLTRMASEGFLPRALLVKNRYTFTPHRIILGFYIVTLCLLFQTHGDLTLLGGVYTISFLGVLLIASLGCLHYRWKSRRWKTICLTASAGIISGLIGQGILQPHNWTHFAIYFAIFYGCTWSWLEFGPTNRC